MKNGQQVIQGKRSSIVATIQFHIPAREVRQRVIGDSPVLNQPSSEPLHGVEVQVRGLDATTPLPTFAESFDRRPWIATFLPFADCSEAMPFDQRRNGGQLDSDSCGQFLLRVFLLRWIERR